MRASQAHERLLSGLAHQQVLNRSSQQGTYPSPQRDGASCSALLRYPVESPRGAPCSDAQSRPYVAVVI